MTTLTAHHATYTAFSGRRWLYDGDLTEAVRSLKACYDGHPDHAEYWAGLSLFHDQTGEVVPVDLAGAEDEVFGRLRMGLGALADASGPAVVTRATALAATRRLLDYFGKDHPEYSEAWCALNALDLERFSRYCAGLGSDVARYLCERVAAAIAAPID